MNSSDVSRIKPYKGEKKIDVWETMKQTNEQNKTNLLDD